MDKIFIDIIKNKNSFSIGAVHEKTSEYFYGQINLKKHHVDHHLKINCSSFTKVGYYPMLNTSKIYMDLKKDLYQWLEKFKDYEIWSYRLKDNVFNINTFDLNTILYTNSGLSNIDITEFTDIDIEEVSKNTDIPVLRNAFIIKNLYKTITKKENYLVSLLYKINTPPYYYSSPIAVTDNKIRGEQYINAMNKSRTSQEYQYSLNKIEKI